MSTKKLRPITQYKTAVFQIHNPSNRKKAILRDMLVKSHEAYSKTLNHWLPSEAEVQALLKLSKTDRKKHLRGKSNALSKYVFANFKHISGSAKFGIIEDVKAQILSYVELHEDQQSKSRTGKPGKPTAQSISNNHSDFIDYSIYKDFYSCIDLKTENSLRDKTAMLRKQGKIRPVELPKSNVLQGFLLLHNPDKDKYYAYINTHNYKIYKDKSRFAESANIKLNLTILSGSKKGQPCVPNKDGYSINSKTGILLPLAFSKDFQYKEFIAKGTAKTAKLVRVTERKGKTVDIYELHIAFEFIADSIQPETYLGVDRGIYNLASLTVIRKNGKVLESENIDGMALRSIQKHKLQQTKTAQKKGKIVRDRTRKAIADENIHIAVNQIIALAVKHKSQIVLEKLKGLISHSPRPKGQWRSNFRKVFTRQQYSKLAQVLEYKRKLYGLPPIYHIHPAYISQLCPKCGHVDKKNREKIAMGDIFKMDIFKCTDCAYEADADINASRNIALKGLFYKEMYKNNKKHTPDNKKELFIHFVKQKSEN